MLRELVLIVAIFAAADVRPPSTELPFLVIVHRSNRVSSISRAELSAIFMKRTRRWADGAEVLPVEPAARSPLRERFSVRVHDKSVAYVTRYWQRLIFAGRGIPPPQLRDDSAVLEYVSTHRGAIGYISRESAGRDDVKVIVVTP
jgi:ABC-type phosphate transport system substrate-binding protein